MNKLHPDILKKKGLAMHSIHMFMPCSERFLMHALFPCTYLQPSSCD